MGRHGCPLPSAAALFALALALAIGGTPSLVQAAASPGAADAGAVISSDEGATRPKRMDGVVLEAIESYINPRRNEFDLGVGLYPFDAYYYGLSVNLGYTNHFSRNFAWEVFHAGYYISFAKNLTTELADRYKVDPTTIPSLNFDVSSDFQYVVAYGKFLLFEDLIRYYRSTVFAGAGVVGTTDGSAFAANFGVKFEVFARSNFAWTFEARDNLAVGGSMNNYLSFVLGTGISF